MAVPESKRGTGKFDVLIKANDLTVYTIRITKNPNTFAPEYQTALTDDIIRTAKKKLDGWTYEKTETVLNEQYDGDTGYNPGSQMVQIAGISVLDELDHYIKEVLRIKYYIRYMDDFILIHESEEYLNTCREKIEAKLQDKGFAFNQKKTKVYSLRKGVTFLGFTFKLTDTGKVILILKPKNVKQERKKLYRLVQQAKRGEKPKAKVDECYNGWRNHAAKGNSTKLLRRMDKYYKDLWKGEA